MVKQINIEILDYFNREKIQNEIEWIEEELIEKRHKEIQEKYPDCNVNFYWEKYDGKHILGKVKNIEKDRLLVNEGKMDWEIFINKWFPSTIIEKKWEI